MEKWEGLEPVESCYWPYPFELTGPTSLFPLSDARC